MAGLLPPYPVRIFISNVIDSEYFYIKVKNVNSSIILCTCSADTGKIGLYTTSVEGNPSTLVINAIQNELKSLIPYYKKEDTSIYFYCNAAHVIGRTYTIYVFSTYGYKNNVSYEIITDTDKLLPVE